jgi:hypothetical protein
MDGMEMGRGETVREESDKNDRWRSQRQGRRKGTKNIIKKKS